MSDIGAPYIGRSLRRREDRRLLTGRGQFIADLVLPRVLHAVLVRSPLAHARIRDVDLSRARAAPGVAMALNGADLLQMLPPVPEGQISLPRKWTTVIQHKFLNPQQPLLAYDKVRHVGEAVAIIAAETRDQAEDAAERVGLDLEELPPVVDPEAGLRPDSPIVHDRFDTNLIGEFKVTRGDPDAAMARAPHRLKRGFYHHRYAAVPMECRGVVSAYDPRTGSATIWSSTQVVHWVRREAAALLGLPEAQVRCVALDVGGGFGGKGHVYPEDLLVTFLAHRLDRPVRWIEDRREHLMSATHSRDQWHDVEIGFDDDGHILAIRDDYLVDCGAWNPIGSGVAYNTAVHLTGPYKIENLAARGRIVVTNKVPNAPYRGAGRPEAAFAMERSIDLVARTLGLEPAEIRRRNMIPTEEMPYRVGIPYRDGEPIVYDSGDYPRALQKTLDAAMHQPSAKLRDKVFAIAANLLECSPADLELREGGVGVVGVPGATLSLSRIAQASRPGWENPRPPGIEAGLEEIAYWQPPTVTWSYAVHAAIVEVDPDTGRVTLENYAVTHDCGTVVNPMLVEGQIMGGAVQGLGGILGEAIAYDSNGQLLSGSLMDYALPIATDVPPMTLVHQHSPSPLNPLGVKGVGEGGAVAPPAAIANAVCDALAPSGIEINATPIRPEEIVRFLRPR